MRLLLGMILGALLTVAGAYAYDTSTGRAPNGLSVSAAGARPPMVNWDVVSDNWSGVQTNLRNLSADVEKGWKRITS
jgi:hypothetical protein